MTGWDLGHFANYPGDVRHMVGEIVGPADDFAGTMYRAKSVEYDPETNKSRVEFVIVGSRNA